MQQLNYPILMYTETFIQGKIKNEKYLCMRTIKSFDSKLYDNGVIIDSKGLKYKILSYRKRLHWYVVLVNFADAIFDFFTRPIGEYSTWIEFSISEPEQLTFENAKCEIANLVNNHPRWFKKSHEDVGSIEEKLSQYGSLNELIKLFAGYP